MLYVLGVQAGVKVHDRLEGSQATVEEQQQQLELSVGGTVRQTLLQDAQRLPHHVLVPCDTPETNVQRRSLKQRQTRNQREREELTGVRPQVDVYVSCHETIHVRELQLRLQSVRPCETKKSTSQNKLFTRSSVCFITESKRSYQTSVRADSEL